MTIYSFDILLSRFGTSMCSMSSSNCCLLTYVQISQETGKVVWYSHLLKSFPQFVMIHTVKGFGVINKAEVDVFLEFSCFFDGPKYVSNLISGSSDFSKSSLNIWSLWLTYCWRLACRILMSISLYTVFSMQTAIFTYVHVCLKTFAFEGQNKGG